MQQRRVLIVEDEWSFRRALARSLESLGYEVTEADDGHAAVRIVRANPCTRFDVVILDYSMPGLTGGEAANLMRAACPDLPVVYLSGHDLPADLQASEIVLMKPVSVEELDEAIERKLRSVADTDPFAAPEPRKGGD